MIIEYEGQSYSFEFADITVKQAMKLEKHTGMKLTDWGDALEAGNHFPALQALGWLVLFRGEGPVDDADFKLGPFGDAFIKAVTGEVAGQKAEEGAERPTVPASNGQTPAQANSLLSSVPVSP